MELTLASGLVGAPTDAQDRLRSRTRRAEPNDQRTRAWPAHHDGHGGELPAALELEDLWDRHGRSAYALACVLLGDEVSAAEAVRLAMADLAGSADGVSTEEAPRVLARHVYRHSQELVGETPSTMQLPPVMVWLSQLAKLQRACLGLCFFGGLTHREAAALLGVPPGTVADLLTASLRELGRLAARETPASA